MNILRSMKAWLKRVLSGRHSIQQRLPLLICLLLLSIIISFSYISYIGVKKLALKTSKERLLALSDQLSSMFAQSVQTNITTTRTAANQASIREYVLTKETGYQLQAQDILQKLRLDSTWVLTELLDKDHQVLLFSSRDSILSDTKFKPVLSSLTFPDSAGIGKLYLLKDSMYYPIVAPVRENKQTVGYLVRWRRVSTSAKTLEQFSQLMGTKAKLYFGNNDGSLWTDMLKPVPYERFNGRIMEIHEYSGLEGKMLAMTKPIINSPWLVTVEFPKKLVLETANRFLQWTVLIGLILIVIGILLARRISRNITVPLKNLTAAASSIAAGNYLAKVEVNRSDEIGKLARAFNAMTSKVSKAKNELEEKVIEMAEVNEQLRNLSAYLQNVREDERMHIAREMHDELGQLLTGFKMDAAWLKSKVSEAENPAVKERLNGMLPVIDEAVTFVRTLATELRPSILDDLGLIPALQWHSKEFEKRYNIHVRFHSNRQEFTISSMIATGLFRIYQECLTNVARHSNATEVESRFLIINDEISLTVADNGKGFDSSRTSKKTLGLLGMKERAVMLGGKMEIVSEVGKGTTILIAIKQPWPQKDKIK